MPVTIGKGLVEAADEPVPFGNDLVQARHPLTPTNEFIRQSSDLNVAVSQGPGQILKRQGSAVQPMKKVRILQRSPGNFGLQFRLQSCISLDLVLRHGKFHCFECRMNESDGGVRKGAGGLAKARHRLDQRME